MKWQQSEEINYTIKKQLHENTNQNSNWHWMVNYMSIGYSPCMVYFENAFYYMRRYVPLTIDEKIEHAEAHRIEWWKCIKLLAWLIAILYFMFG